MSSTSMMYGDATIFDLLGCCCVVCSCSLLEPSLPTAAGISNLSSGGRRQNYTKTGLLQRASDSAKSVHGFAVAKKI